MMNTFTGAIFTIIIVVGCLMVIWWVVIMLLGMDIRKDIRNMGGKLPVMKKSPIIVSSLLNLLIIAITIGYFNDITYNFYAQNQWLITMGGIITLVFTCINNDHLHHQLMINIGCFNETKRKFEEAINNNIENKNE